MRLLLERGADPRYMTDKGFGTDDFAAWGKDPEVLALLAARASQDPAGDRDECDE